MKTLLLLFLCSFYTCVAQTTFSWNGSASSSWNNATNWTPNGIPGSTDNITIVSGANSCVLNANASVTNIIMSSGTLDLGGFTLNATGNATFTSGTINNGILNVSSSTGNTATLGNTNYGVSLALNITAGAISVNGGTYNGPAALNQTGTVQTTGTGGATFNDNLTITNSGTNNFRINGNCTYNGTTTFNNSGGGYFLPELNSGSTYNGNLTLNNTSTAQHIRMCFLGNSVFNGNISVNNNSGNSIGIVFCEQATATATLANGKTITVGGSGFASGQLNLQRFTQQGSTAQNITLTGTAALYIAQASTFNGALTISSPNFYLSNSTFNGVTTLTKTDGTTSNANSGGNTFNNTLYVNYSSVSGTGYLSFANGTRDIYNGDVYSNNNSLDRIIFGHASTNNLFNGNLFVSQLNSSVGTSTTWNSGTTCVFAAGKTIQTGPGGFSAGWLYLQGITQAAADPITLTTTGTSAVFTGNGSAANPCTFSGALTITAPDIYLRGSTYNAPVVVNKTGGIDNHNNGNLNTFNSTFTVNQQSTTGYFMVGYNSNDQFNDDIIVTNTGSRGISFGWSGGTGMPVLASGKNLVIGGAGFSGGYLQLGSFTKLGTGALNIIMTGNSEFYVVNPAGPCLFGGPVNVTAPNLYIRGGTFNGPTVFTKTGGIDNHNNGGQNIFNAPLTINQQSTTGYFLLSYNSADQFNDNITVTNTGTQGISLGWGGGTGTPVLASGKTIQVGAAGFTGGYLQLGSFTHNGSTPMNLTLTGTAFFQVINTPGSCVFNAPISVTAPDLYIRGATFNASTTFTKTGGVDNHNNGGQNTFNAPLTINQQSTSGYFMLGYNSNDLFNDNITVTNTGTRGISLGWTSGTGTPTLAAGKTINVGGAGFTGGYLQLGTFTQLGNAPINLTFTGTSAQFTTTMSTVIGGNLTISSPDIFFNGATFNGTVTATKTGPNGQWGSGGNIFNGASTFNNTSAGYFGLANGTADIYNGDVFTNNSGTERILFGNGPITLQFNGNITLTESGSAVGTQFSWGGTTSCVQAAGKTISIAGGYTSGYLIFERFTQLGTGAITLPLATTANLLRFGPASSFGGNIVCSAPSVFFYSTTFNGTVNATKTGPNGDWSAGGNTFATTLTLTNTSSGYMGMANSAVDIYNGDVYTVNTGPERIIFNNVAGGNCTFNGDIIVSQSGSGVGTALNWNATATGTIAAGKTIRLGAGGFSCGYLYTQRITQLGNAAVTLPMTGTSSLYFGPGTLLGGNVNSTSGDLFFNGCTFSGTVTSVKNGPLTNNSDGGNTFNGTVVITNNGAGAQFLLQNLSRDVFNAPATFNHNGDYRFYFAHNHTGQTTVFNSDLTLNSNKSGTGTDGWAFFGCEGNNTSFTVGGNFTLNVAGNLQSNCRFMNGTGNSIIITGTTTIANSNTHTNTALQMTVNGTGTFNGNMVVSNTGGGASSGIYFGVGTATSTLANTKTIALGPGGFTSGILSLLRFIQVGGTAQSLVQTSGPAALYLGPFSSFDGGVTFSFPQVYLQGTTYNGTATITKNGATDNAGAGGNIFNGVTVINNSGSGYLMTGNVNRDQFNASTTFNNTGTYRMYFAHNHTGQTTTFASDVTINTAKTGGTDGYSFLIAEGTNTSVSFGGPVNINVAGGPLQSVWRILTGTGTSATYNGPVTITIPNSNTGTVVQMSNNGISTYNDNIIVSNSGGSGGVYFNVNAVASSTLSNTKTISLGAGGFPAGTLSLVRFAQLGGTPQTLVQSTGTGALYLGPTSSFDGNITFNFPQVYLNSATYNGTATITKNGATDNAGTGGNVFNGVTVINNSGSGYLMTGNVTRDQFNASTTFNNTGSYRIYFAYNHTGQTTTFTQDLTLNSAKTSGADPWSYLIAEGNNLAVSFGGDVSMNTSGSIRGDLRILQGTGTTAVYNGNLIINNANTQVSNQLQLGATGISTYNGNITMSNTGGGASGGVFFNTSGTAASTLASGKAIGLGAGGFTGGTLSLIRFTQLGSAVQTLNQATGTGILISGPSNVFYGDVNFNFPQVYLNGAVYNAAATIQKNGATDNDCIGSNTFNGTTSIANIHAVNRLRLANTTADTYNADVTFIQNNAGVLAPNYNTNCTYAGNITASSSGTYTITFGSGTGTATLTGSNAQSINKSGTAGYPVFTRLVLGKSAMDVTLNTRVNISSALTLTQGIMNTTQANILNMNDNTSTTIGNSLSYINGPMNYDMAVSNTTRLLNMPVGKGPEWRPVVLTVRHSAATSYTYNSEVFNASAAALGWTLPVTVDTVSSVHYWDINRYTTGTTTSVPSANLSYSAGAYPLVQIYFGTDDGVYQGPNLTIVKNTSAAPTTWIDIGGSSGIGNNAVPVGGSVISTSSPSAFNSFSRFTLGSKTTGFNPLPVEYVTFDAEPNGKVVNLNWTTAREENSNYFAIERSPNGTDFTRIGTHEAVHYSTAYTNYSAVDESPIKGMNYYRITEYDYNNSTFITPIKTVLFDNSIMVSYYPNPAKDLLQFSSESDSEITVELLSLSGVMVSRNTFVQEASVNLAETNLASGLYIVKIIAGGQNYFGKVVIEK
jgi:hypothetical protein